MISVIISTYNRKDKLKKAIDSVLNQSFKDFEIIITDDKSLDGTREMVKEYSKKDKRIKYTRLSSHFGNDTLPKNNGIKMATGEYICFLDDDNTYTPDHLLILHKKITTSDFLDVVYGDRMIIDEQGKSLGIGVHSNFDPFLLMQRNFIDTSDVIVKKSTLLAVGGFDERFKKFIDWNLWIRLLKYGAKFERVPYIITNYLIHSGSKSLRQEDQQSNGMPAWNPQDLEVELPYLETKSEPKVAIYSITYNRLEYSKKCFKSLQDTTDYPFDHYVIDNGSEDGTQKWLKEEYKPKCIRLNLDNKGISIASNEIVNLIKHRGKEYDIIVKVDNDCYFQNKGWLKKMVELWKSNHMLALSCYVQGLKDNPGGSPRVEYGMVNNEVLGLTRHIGGICCFCDARAYDVFRWDEKSTLHGVQDLEFSQYLRLTGHQLAYLENWYCDHYEGTEGQHQRYPEYFEKRKLEKQKSYAKNS